MTTKQRKPYRTRRPWTLEQKLEILRHAFQYGDADAIRKYDLVSSLIHTWRRQFKKKEISINTSDIKHPFNEQRRIYSRGRKKEMVQESFEIGVNAVCEKYNIHRTLIYRWRKELGMMLKDFVKKGMSINSDKDLKLCLNDNLILEEPGITKEYVENQINPLGEEFSKLFKQLGEDYADFKDIQRITNEELRMQIKHWRKFTGITYWMSGLSFLAVCALSIWVYYLMGQIK